MRNATFIKSFKKSLCGIYTINVFLLGMFFLVTTTSFGCKDIETSIDSTKKVGLAYCTWHRPELWSNYWGTPELGKYNSNDRNIIRQHGQWLADAGVDFVFIDWSNDINYGYGVTTGRADFDMIEKTVPILFEEWKSIQNAPKIAIMLGCPGETDAFSDGRMKSKFDQVYNQFIANTKNKDQYYTYQGKPLIIVYVGTPSPFQTSIPSFKDSRFTIRYMTGFVTQQPNLINTKMQSIYGYWSWEDRGEQTYSLYNGKPEACTVSAASRAQSGPDSIPAIGRNDGATFKARWDRAISLNVSTALVVSWNEWVTGEQPSAEVSKDLEPSVGFGHKYLDLLKTEIEAFKKTK